MYITNSKLIRDKLSFFRYQYFILFSLLFFVASFSLSAQTQLGSDIDGLLGTSNITPFGQSTGDGATVSLSSDGTTVAIGNFGSDNSRKGWARIFRWNGSDWAQLGATLEGNVSGEKFGYQVSLSSDGSIVAISGYQGNWVRVFSWNGSAWLRLGVDILGKGDKLNDNFGTRLQLSSDGTRLVVSAPLDGLYGSGNPDMRYAGNVRVYDYTPSGTASWTHIGQDIYGTVGGGVYGDQSGLLGLSISDDGSRIAIGSHSYDGGGPYLSSFNDNRGQVRIFEYTPSGTASWTQLGPSIDGETGDSSGDSVTLSSDGSIVAISAPFNDSYGTNKGIVRIYSYTPSGVSSWTQLGDPIVGEAELDGIGKVSISDDGSIIAIGTSDNDGYGTSSGHVRIFSYTPSGVSSWTQVGIDIDGEAAGDRSAGALSLSSDGSKVAIGAPSNYPNGEYRPRGHVRIFSTAADTSTPTVTLTDTDLDNLASGSSVVTITATFSEAMSATPTINITGEVSNVAMTASRTARVWIYPWTVSATTSGIVTATVSGTDLSGNAYEGTTSITFTIDNTAPTVTLTDTDSDNLTSGSSVVTITATFSESMAVTPTINITGEVSNVAMTASSTASVWIYPWTVSTTTSGIVSATVAGTDVSGKAYAGTTSITFTIDNTAPTVNITTSDSDNTSKICR